MAQCSKNIPQSYELASEDLVFSDSLQLTPIEFYSWNKIHVYVRKK